MSISFKKIASLLLRIAILCLFPIDLFAQDIYVKGKISLGNEGANKVGVSVTIKGGNIGTVTNEEGRYEILAKTTDTLVFSCIGYKTEEIACDGNGIIDVQLEPDFYELEEVVVSAPSGGIEHLGDKYVIHLDKINSHLGLLSESMNKMPLLKVTDNSIEMFGKSSVLVFVNNQEVQLSGESLINYLNSFPNEVIKSVEISSSPSSEYDAQEDVGVVKINISRKVLPGIRAQFNGGFIQNHYGSGMLSSFVNYQGRHLFIDANAFGSLNNSLNSSIYTSTFPLVTNESNSSKKWNTDYLNLNLAFGYEFSENHSLIASAQIPVFNKENIIDLKNESRFINNKTFSIDSLICSDGITTKDTHLYNFDLLYEGTIGKDINISAGAGYVINNVNSSREWLSKTDNSVISVVSESLFSKGDIRNQILTAKVDLSFHTLGFNTKVGYKFSNSSTNSNSLISPELAITGNASDIYEYKEIVNAVYFNAKKKIEKLFLSFGLRGEFSQTTGKNTDALESHSASYFNLFPVATISYSYNDNSIALTYNRRIERPKYEYLDPFKWYTSKYDYSMGNPALRPSFVDNLKIEYLYSDSFLCSIFYSHNKDIIGRYVIIDSLDVRKQIQFADNFLSSNSIGALAEYSVSPMKWLDLYLSASAVYTNYLSSRKEFKNTRGWKSDFEFDLNFNIGQNLCLFANAIESLPGVDNYRNVSNSFKFDLGATFLSKSQRMLIKLEVDDIFNTSVPPYFYYCNNNKQTYNNDYDTRRIKLVLIWKLGNLFSNNKYIPESSGLEERRRL